MHSFVYLLWAKAGAATATIKRAITVNKTRMRLIRYPFRKGRG